MIRKGSIVYSTFSANSTLSIVLDNMDRAWDAYTYYLMRRHDHPDRMIDYCPQCINADALTHMRMAMDAVRADIDREHEKGAGE